jgi:hypothetical protein
VETDYKSLYSVLPDYKSGRTATETLRRTEVFSSGMIFLEKKFPFIEQRTGKCITFATS